MRACVVVLGRQVEGVRVPVPDAPDGHLVVGATVGEFHVELGRHAAAEPRVPMVRKWEFGPYRCTAGERARRGPTDPPSPHEVGSGRLARLLRSTSRPCRSSRRRWSCGCSPRSTPIRPGRGRWLSRILPHLLGGIAEPRAVGAQELGRDLAGEVAVATRSRTRLRSPREGRRTASRAGPVARRRGLERSDGDRLRGWQAGVQTLHGVGAAVSGCATVPVPGAPAVDPDPDRLELVLAERGEPLSASGSPRS